MIIKTYFCLCILRRMSIDVLIFLEPECRLLIGFILCFSSLQVSNSTRSLSYTLNSMSHTYETGMRIREVVRAPTTWFSESTDITWLSCSASCSLSRIHFILVSYKSFSYLHNKYTEQLYLKFINYFGSETLSWDCIGHSFRKRNIFWIVL